MIELFNTDCLEAMKQMPDKAYDLAIVDDLQCGKAGEYLVCADLIIKGFVAYPSEQGLPYDVVMDYNGKLLKVQVKTTRGLRNLPQRKIPVNCYIFNIKRRGKGNKQRTTENTCDLFALVALDTKEIGYMLNKDVKETMNFRATGLNGKYRDENINGQKIGRYLSDFKLEDCLCQL
jgi:hypothetical protein